MSTIFYHLFIFLQIIALQKLWKISSKKLFLFLRYSTFCIFGFPSFFPVSHCFRGWFKKNLKVYDVINCLNKNLITHFVWYLEKEIRFDIETLSIDRVLNTKWKNHAAPDQFLILLYNQIARNSFGNKIFWKRIIKKPLKS